MAASLARVTEMFDEAYRAAAGSGDPALLKEATEARQRWFDGMLEAKVKEAERVAQQSVEDMAPVIGREEAQMRARSVIEDSMRDARKQESALWEEVPTDLDVPTSATSAAYEEVREGLLLEEHLRSPIDAFLRRLRKSSGETPEDPFEASGRRPGPIGTRTDALVPWRTAYWTTWRASPVQTPRVISLAH